MRATNTNEDSKSRLCPRCERPMNEGYLAGGGLGIAFYPGERKYGLVTSFRMIGKFFSGKHLFRFIGTKAFCCSDCREVYFRY